MQITVLCPKYHYTSREKKNHRKFFKTKPLMLQQFIGYQIKMNDAGISLIALVISTNQSECIYSIYQSINEYSTLLKFIQIDQ